MTLPLKQADKLALKLKDKLQLVNLNHLAIESGFVKRKPRKITPLNILLGLFIMILTGGNSLSTFAITIGLISSCRLSKQAVDKRIKTPLVQFLESVLAWALSHSAQKCESLYENLSTKFKRILIQDSTSIQIDSELAKYFPGNKNASGKKFAIMKIQALFDILNERFVDFGISAFTKNDQKASRDILDIVRSGDLIIRDLGYFVLSVLKAIQLKGAFFISRLKHGVSIFELDGKTPFNLVEKLKKYGRLDIDVIVGAKEKLVVRLVAIPVPEEVAAERRRKARRNRDRRLNPSKEHLTLLGWNIFIMNIDRDTLDADQIAELYGCRWRIETIFKSWKSHFNLTNVPKASECRVKAYVYSTLIFVTLFQAYVFVRMYKKIYEESAKQLSLLKVCRFFKEQVWAIILFFNDPEILEDQISYHCTYESRKDRINYMQKISFLS